jgi:hypothetical protein
LSQRFVRDIADVAPRGIDGRRSCGIHVDPRDTEPSLAISDSRRETDVSEPDDANSCRTIGYAGGELLR